MNKILEFGRKAIFYVRVLSGYEERRIRSFRLELQQRLQHAQERKMALRKIPEQTLLAELRRMVEEMQTVKRKLDETEAAIEEYFKPIDKEAQIMMDIQLKGEEKNMKEMVKLMQEQAMAEKAAQEEANLSTLDAGESKFTPNEEKSTPDELDEVPPAACKKG